VFCALEKFHRHLRRRDIYAEASTRWRDPRAHLLDGEAWQLAKGPALTELGLPETPDALLASHARRLDATYRKAAGRLVVNTDVRVDADGKLHVAYIEAVPDPDSLTDLRNWQQAMLPKVDLPELILEVMVWHPAFIDAFTAVSGGESRLADLNVSVAVLTSHALNVGYAPIIAPGVPALGGDRLSHVDQNYMRAETYKVANAALIKAQAGTGLAREWGGGLVAAIDGIRFVVPIPTIHARPNPKYWGRRRGAQWISMMNDQFAGTGGIVVAGTPRDSLHAIDVIYSQDGGPRPEVIITDTPHTPTSSSGCSRSRGSRTGPRSPT
jgi:Tn3 transposase DDE domain